MKGTPAPPDDPVLARLEHRFDLFEYKLLSLIDRRLRQQSWMLIWAILVSAAVAIVAARI